MNREILRGAAASVVYILAVVFVGVAQLRLIVETLPREIAGLWLLFLTVGSYITFFDLSVGPTVGREISFSAGDGSISKQERAKRIGELLATANYVFRIAAVGIGFVSLIVGEILIFSSRNYRSHSGVGWSWAVFSIGAALNLLGSTAFAGLFGLGSVAAEKLIRALSLLVGLGLTLIALKLNMGLLGLALAWVLQGILAVTLAWRQLRRQFREVSSTVYPRNWQLAKRLAYPSLKLVFIQLCAILILQSANPVIALVIGTAAIPSYEAVAKIATTMMTLAWLIVNSSTPFLSMAYAAGDLEKLKLLLFRNLRIGLSLMVILCAFVAVNGDRIVLTWLGPGVFPGFGVLWVLLVMVLLEVHHLIFAVAAMAVGQLVFVWAALASAVLNIGLAIFLSGRYGLLGVALAVAIAQLATNNWYVPFFTVRFFNISTAALAREVWMPMIVLIIAQLATVILLNRLPWPVGPRLATLVINFAVCMTVGGTMCWFLALRASERTRIFELLHGSPG